MRERSTTRLALLAALASAASAGHAQSSDERNFRLRIGQRLSEETNLYRLPEGIDPALVLGDGAQRDDEVLTSSVALTGQWRRGSQGVVLDTSLAANRFSGNGDLDNTSGRGNLAWNWQIGKWSAQLGGRRERSLANFANSESIEKDMLDVTGRYGEARFDATPRWSATFGARDAVTEHGNALRTGDDVTTRTATVGVQYRTPRGDSVGLETRRERGEFALPQPGGQPSPSDYDERRTRVTLRYAIAAKLALDAGAGRADRAYPHGMRGDFTGDVWNVALRWPFSAKTTIALERWQDIRAQLDVESEHFVSTGTALTAAWSPSRAVQIALQASRERQRYIGIGSAALDDDSLRRDIPLAGSLVVTYAPRERFSLDVAYRREERGSTAPRFDYAAESLAVAWNVVL